MTELADVQTLISQANESFRTLRATIQFSRDAKRCEQAWDRHVERLSQGVGRALVIRVGEPPSGTQEATARLWIERPGRFREEYGGRSSLHVTISDGETLWRRAPRLGPFRERISEESGLMVTELLVDPAPLVTGLVLELLGDTQHAGRHAHHVRGVPPQHVCWDDWHDLYGLAPGADEYSLLIDADRGTLLRAGALLDGTEFAFSDVEEISFDEDLPPDRFVLELAPGERVRTHEELAQQFSHAQPFWVEVTLAEAIRRASFILWVTEPRRAWRVWARYRHPHDDYSTPEAVQLVDSHMQKAQLTITETPRDETRGSSWGLIRRDGREYRVWHDNRRPRLPTKVRFHKERTSIELQAWDLDRDQLFEIADSMIPAASPSP